MLAAVKVVEPPDVLAGLYMRYDLSLVHELCKEAGLSSNVVEERVEVELGHGAVLCFQNALSDEDCLIGFAGTSWHVHDDLTFADSRGNYVRVSYLDLIELLRDGHILVCERQMNGHIVDRWLTHCEVNDEFKYFEEGEQLTVRRAARALASE